MKSLFIAMGLLLAVVFQTAALMQVQARAQVADEAASETTVTPEDQIIYDRLSAVYSELEALQDVRLAVRNGVVKLSGSVATDAAAERAQELALKINNVLTVEESIARSREISTNVSPLLDSARAELLSLYIALPVIGIALGVFLVITLTGHFLAGWTRFWERILPNPFLAELVSSAIRLVAIIFGLIVSLNLIGATALMGAILGGAGVLGLAIGFAVREGLENYISSIMLSVRQPFRANEHVKIDDLEGKVVRLTSRATVLMTLDGNHLRIPNSTVFKAIILNYTRNPERRFSFELGVDAADDPLAAISLGVETMMALDFLLDEPEPIGLIKNVGDSNIVITYFAWVDQRFTSFAKARSIAIAKTKNALETGGFSLPEPIYRLKLDGGFPAELSPFTPETPKTTKPKTSQSSEPVVKNDVEPDHHLEKKVEEERAEQPEKDLLDQSRPVE